MLGSFPLDRRGALLAGLGMGLGAAAAPSYAATTDRRPEVMALATELGVIPNRSADQSVVLQAAIDHAAMRRVVLALPSGRYVIGKPLTLRAGARLKGVAGETLLVAPEGGTLLAGEGADNVALEAIVLIGGAARIGGPASQGTLLSLRRSARIELSRLAVLDAAGNGIHLEGCSGAVRHCRIANAGAAGLLSLDARGLEIAGNHVHDCGDNGILVWSSRAAEDGTMVTGNRVERIAARSGGTGQNGNGINVFRAGGVLVSGNRITECAYSAIRANSASNIAMTANSCARLGEVALYAEFAFEGAVIANNLVDGAATGISVTNFNEGGRLAVVQGNLIRNLGRREHEPQDKRGEGIAVEADAAICGNVIENAPTAGIWLGWGPHLRNIAATGNTIRNARIGIAVQAHEKAGAVLVASNLISGSRDGAVRAMRHAEPIGGDLARGAALGGVTVTGNVVA